MSEAKAKSRGQVVSSTAKVSISVPGNVLEEAKKNAERAGRSLSNYIAFAMQRLNDEAKRARQRKRAGASS